MALQLLNLEQMVSDAERVFGYDVVAEKFAELEATGLLMDREQMLEQALLMTLQSFLNCELDD